MSAPRPPIWYARAFFRHLHLPIALRLVRTLMVREISLSASSPIRSCGKS